MLNPAVLKNAPLLIDKRAQGSHGGAVVTQKRTVRGQHIMYDFTEPTCRVRQDDIVERIPKTPDDTSELGMYGLVLRPDVAGNTFYLPYGWDEVHSVRMPRTPAHRCAFGLR